MKHKEDRLTHGSGRNEDLGRTNEPGKGLKQNTSLSDDDKSRIEKSREAGNKKLSDRGNLGKKENMRDKLDSDKGFRTMDDDEVNIL